MKEYLGWCCLRRGKKTRCAAAPSSRGLWWGDAGCRQAGRQAGMKNKGGGGGGGGGESLETESTSPSPPARARARATPHQTNMRSFEDGACSHTPTHTRRDRDRQTHTHVNNVWPFAMTCHCLRELPVRRIALPPARARVWGGAGVLVLRRRLSHTVGGLSRRVVRADSALAAQFVVYTAVR